ncbi:pyruvate dehydrogenase E2 component (dihydrolipoamide acetyltransferase) [Isoptericola sp. CG 20/1183]|uniref:Dihydrolipoamide acetyltransferase component of pyruvate dehydrogenase complex n=1 Tax=Isoptericola halotolerans TaxID=300560 RepID=A0ABX5EHZ6_9MICO|nr:MULTISPECIES: dihydrolipoamide acetyltransferase family protein [Isoptericola]PRZ02502.1 pyruvate dehydrogenase E2 component (dihydrolipoamide acetyltransferase) [Isoptericola sp. CG 20/1183]PRZ09296.1 pyruvate dehydrogenase E2 component (dihydrolipoamide acetyltransferase) [Isoptericola sp. CG 20/1183]PRZ10097.1 pyruvate dehydrogenase E2 component (dihydrolipoamide acetyltransferase) [Isoptericola halotolerans]
MSTQRFPLPDVGEGLTEAEIVEWKVAVGDTVAVNDVIVEIETAKSLVELPSPFAGTVVALLAEEGTTVDVGTPIIEVGSADASASEPAPSGAPASPGDSSGGSTNGEGSGSVLVGYGTGDAAAGSRRRRRRAEEPAAPATAASKPAPAPAPAPAPSSAPERTPGIAKPMMSVPAAVDGAGAASSGTTPAGRIRVLAKPPVRKLAKDLGVDLASVQPTGPGGIVTREDVVARADAAEPRTLATYPDDDQPWLASGSVTNDGRQTRVPVKSVRKRTAEVMVASAFTAPHVTVFRTVDVTRTMKLVEKLKADRDFADVRVTPLLIAAKAALLAIKRHPEINASWDDEAREIVYKHYVNLGIAAATPRGLVVPNVKDAHRHELLPLARALAELTATARAGRTSPADMSDGTFTITNVGVFGIDTGTPILNPGEAGILAFGAIRQQPWVHKGKVKPRWVTQLALSFDHRLVDGELGSRFLSDVARVLEDPAHGLVWG